MVRWQGHVTIAGAGRHVLYAIDAGGEAQIIAGTGGEELRDGPALQSLLAQPSALTLTADGELVFVDAESSALRVLDRPAGAVRTLVGGGLFDWGSTDGDRDHARLQHPLGVAGAPGGALYVADTYNDRLRVWRGEHLWTVPVDGFCEPGGVDVLPDGRLVVADTGNHRVVLVDPDGAQAEAVDVGRPASSDQPGAPVVAETRILEAGGVMDVALDIDLDGDALDTAGRSPVLVRASATDPGLLDGRTSWVLDALPARVAVGLGTGSGRITLELRVATCGADACRLRHRASLRRHPDRLRSPHDARTTRGRDHRQAVGRGAGRGDDRIGGGPRAQHREDLRPAPQRARRWDGQRCPPDRQASRRRRGHRGRGGARSAAAPHVCRAVCSCTASGRR